MRSAGQRLVAAHERLHIGVAGREHKVRCGGWSHLNMQERVNMRERVNMQERVEEI